MNRRNALIAGIAVAALAGAYFLSRSNAPQPATPLPVAAAGAEAAESAASARPATATAPKPVSARGTSLPPPGTALRNIYADLQARANAGDVDAAARLFRDLDRCSRQRATAWRNAAAMDDLTGQQVKDLRPEQLRTHQMLLDAMELRQQSARNTQALCDGVDEAMLGTLVANLAQAARLGDKEARACYLGRGPLYDPRSLLAHPESLRAYRSDATTMIDAGLAAGDWRIVDLLRHAYEPGAQGLLAGLVAADPAGHYRYLKLYRLGAEPHRAARLDRELAAAFANLTPAQVADADRWAQSALRNGFDGPSTGATPPGWDACAF